MSLYTKFLTLLLLLTCLLNIRGHSQITIPDLIAHYPFSGNAEDSTANANHGIVSGAVLTTDRFGNFNSAYSFDGVDDYIELMDGIDFDSYNEQTISAWVKIEDLATYRSAVVSYAASDTRPYGQYFLFVENSYGVRYDVRHFENNNTTLRTPPNIVSNDWAHLVVSKDASGIMRVYVNAQLVNSKQANPGFNTPASNFISMIGAYKSANTTAHFYGKIDDVSLFNRTLSNDEILTLYTPGNTQPTIELISPNGGEIWTVGSTEDIRWNSIAVTGIDLEYSIDNGNSWISIAQNIDASQGVYSWGVPSVNSCDVLIKVFSSSLSSITDVSNSTFCIEPNTTLQQISLTSDLTLFANQIEFIDGVYRATGDVSINNILKANGIVSIDMVNRLISGNTLLFVDGIPNLGQVDLYNGQFSFDFDEDFLNGVFINEINNTFELAGLPVEIDSLQILSDGLRVDGKLQLPELLDSLEINISTLKITQSNGIEVIGEINLEKPIKVAKTVELTELRLLFDSVNDLFIGTTKLDTKLFGLEAGAKVESGQLDSVGVVIRSGSPIPIGSTGLAFKEGGGALGRINNPPLRLALIVSIVPVGQSSFDFIELNQLTLDYWFGKELEGRGGLRVFDEDLAEAVINVKKDRVLIEGEANFRDVVIGNVQASIRKSASKIDFEGAALGKLQIPELFDFPFDYLNGYLGLPYTLSHIESKIKNNTITGRRYISNVFDLAYSMTWSGSSLETEWAPNIQNLNSTLFSENYLLTSKNQNRFEGKSLRLNSKSLNSDSYFNGDILIQNFELVNNLPLVVIRSSDAANTPNFTLLLPDSSMVDKHNVDDYFNIEYVEYSAENKGFFAIRNALSGIYSIQFENSGNYLIDVFGANFRPTIDIIDVGVVGERMLDIKWSDSDPDNNAKVNFFLDNNNYGFNGIRISEDIWEDDTVDQLFWSGDSIVTGTYYLYASIEDSTNGVSTVYFNNPLNLVELNSPSKPTNFTVQVLDTSLAFNWDTNSPESLNSILYYSTEGRVDYSSGYFNLGDTNSYMMSNFEPGYEYSFMVTNMDSLSKESAPSNIININFISSSSNNSPIFIDQSYPNSVNVNQELIYQLMTFDADGDVLGFSNISTPAGVNLSDNGVLSWVPDQTQAGYHRFEISVNDPFGKSDTTLFRLFVEDSLSSMGIVSLDKILYDGYGESGIIQLNDNNLNFSSLQIDTVIVHLSSTSDSTGIGIKLFEHSVNSGYFSNTFLFNPTSSSGQEIYARYGDEILVTYYDSYPADTSFARSLFSDSMLTGVEQNSVRIPEKFDLENAYPNPFNPSTAIKFKVAQRSKIALDIYNILGEHIISLVDDNLTPGTYIRTWKGVNRSGDRVSSGLYFYTLRAISNGNLISQTKKMLLIK
ncbi:MAG: LamG-like jellyroll fold domain-containing protein [Calditrichia bacterium]